MTRLDRIKLAIQKGFTYNEITGKIYGIRGKEITKKNDGYISIILRDLDNKQYLLLGHQFAYYIKYNKIVEQIDHIDGNRLNNRIDNLREVTNQQNSFNRHNTKGYYFNKRDNNFRAQIKLNNKNIYLGSFDTEKEARQAYLDVKNKYHII